MITCTKDLGRLILRVLDDINRGVAHALVVNAKEIV